MPYTAALFVAGSIAICGLPPLNSFVSELFVYLGLFRAAVVPARWAALPRRSSPPPAGSRRLFRQGLRRRLPRRAALGGGGRAHSRRRSWSRRWPCSP
jgi:hypothetical protein